MTRKDAREKTMQILFQIDARNDWENPDFTKYAKDIPFGDQTEYAKKLTQEVCDKRADIDARLDAQSRGWATGRMAKTDLAVLRLAVGEMLFMDNVPNSVSINEAVNLAKKYGEAQSPKFINAVLSKINRSIEEEV